MLRSRSRITIASTLVASLVAAASASSASTTTVRIPAAQMVLELKQVTWPDARIVSGVQCVGNGGVLPNAHSQIQSTRFVCLVQAWHKPANVSAIRWSRLGAAFKTGDRTAVYRLLGLPLDATRAQVDAAGNRVLGPNTPGTVGAEALDRTHLKLEPSPIPTAWFARALAARHAALGVAVAMEAWYVDHHTYAGATAAALRPAPYSTIVPSNVRIVSAATKTYCLEATAGSTRWSVNGPGGIPAVAPCR